MHVEEMAATTITDESFFVAAQAPTAGHPDKLCDLLADSIVDACLAVDPCAQVHVQCMVGRDVVTVCGEVTMSKAAMNLQQVVRDTLRELGYDSVSKGLDYRRCAVVLCVHTHTLEDKKDDKDKENDKEKESKAKLKVAAKPRAGGKSPRPAKTPSSGSVTSVAESKGADAKKEEEKPKKEEKKEEQKDADKQQQPEKKKEEKKDEKQEEKKPEEPKAPQLPPENAPAEAQTVAHGFATAETAAMLSGAHIMATQLAMRLDERRKAGALPWMGPDGLVQVVLQYRAVPSSPLPAPSRVASLSFSLQFPSTTGAEQIRADILKEIVLPAVPPQFLDSASDIHIHTASRKGPSGYAGSSGRWADTDCFSGLAPSTSLSGICGAAIERTANYAARWIAKSLVHASLCSRVTVQLSYRAGSTQPINVRVNTHGTSKSGKSDSLLAEIVRKNFDLRPAVIARDLGLRSAKFARTASYGHFGRDDREFLWEAPRLLQLQ